MATPRIALAHDDGPLELHNLVRTWNWKLEILLGLALVVWLYGRGTHALWQRAGIGNGVRIWQVGLFLLGIAAIFAAIISPVAALGQGFIAAHTLQHMLITLIATPLLVVSRPVVPLLWSLPRWACCSLGRWWRAPATQSRWQWLTWPLVALLLYAVGSAGWYVPEVYATARNNPQLHAIEQVTLLSTAFLGWWVLFHRVMRRRQPGHTLVYLSALAALPGLLGVFLSTSPVLWYPARAALAVVWRVIHPPESRLANIFVCSPFDPETLNAALLADQQRGGMILWFTASVVYAVILLSVFLSQRFSSAAGRK